MIHFKNAQVEDAQLFFNWKNDPTSRKASINSEVVLWESHFKWFKERLDSPSYRIMVAIDQKKTPVGYIRLEKISNEWIIHFYVCNKQRGKGYGKLVLKQGIKEFQELQQKPINFKALVLHDNKASAACFVANDFKQTGFTIIREKKFIIFTKKT